MWSPFPAGRKGLIFIHDLYKVSRPAETITKRTVSLVTVCGVFTLRCSFQCLSFWPGFLPLPPFADPCADISSSKWVTPKQVRACFTSFKVDPTLRANTIEVVNKTIAFHTSVNYQVHAPAPFASDVHEDLHFDLARIGHSSYPSELDFHIDLSRTFKRLNDGHCVYINNCFDSVFLTFLPTPLVLLTDSHGAQAVHIAPEAFTVASREFADQIDVWQNALPGNLKGKLESLSGAKVLLIDGLDPFVAVEANAAITGSFQSHATRQNSFFSSYNRAATGWNYIMGNFAQMSLPLKDSVTLFVQRANSTIPEFVTLPYFSRKNVATTWTDSASYRSSLCTAQANTNGVDVYANAAKRQDASTVPAVAKFEQQPDIAPADRKKHAINVILDTTPVQDVVLPPTLTPQSPLDGSNGVAQFYLLDDKKTGVLALGSFSASSFAGLQQAMLDGLVNLKSQGASQLIVDVTNNGGGFICLAHWLHRIIVGPASTTVPQAGLDTETRAGPLAQLIVKTIVADPSKVDPDDELLYNPINWASVNTAGAQTQFGATDDWLEPLQKKTINGRADAFSPRMSDICQPFDIAPPSEQLFDPKKVVIVNNGRCASSCSLFSITMAKKQGSKTVVLGGKKGVQQQYCGTVGGQSTDFSTMDTEIKTTHLKNNTLAPPDFLTNSVQGITWRLGFGVNDPTQPEEWQDHPADVNLPLTADIVNNPTAIWNTIAKKLF
ncbi:hypothetical protein QCA50_011447 [Cerrena zonata]|uniref:Tail specific protease domain-containing protein n=1 Tax=Cerrena zonata TaxID=2478898 RepID=A0AAW0G381_9APHY